MNLSFSKRKSLLITLTSLAATNIVTYYFANKRGNNADSQEMVADASLYQSQSNCAVKIQRLNGFDYIKPILFVDKECESDKLSSIKQSVTTLIDEYKRIGTINSAAFYLKEYSNNEWTGINNDEQFLPGSLMKVPELIAILKMEESNPGFLDHRFTYDKTYTVDKHPKYLSKTIQLGNSYTIRQLLEYMIVYSDNEATSLLYEHMDVKIFKKIFADMGLKEPDLTAQNYPITAKDYSIFMRVLYNSSYLSDKHSEFATELLGRCQFKEGLVSGLPASVKVAHKFGEAGDPLHQEFSESAIVYLDNNPYILTVMVKGNDYSKLPGIIKQVSEVVYQKMLSNAKAAS